MNYLPNRNKISRYYHYKLPNPPWYYTKEFGQLKIRGHQAMVRCCFHDDHNPSLSLNLNTGAFHCFACGASGGDVLSFHMRHYNLSFKAAAKQLGAWL